MCCLLLSSFCVCSFPVSYNFQWLEFLVFLFALVLTAWYEGTGPAIFALDFAAWHSITTLLPRSIHSQWNVLRLRTM
jgi:hypothetical protein